MLDSMPTAIMMRTSTVLALDPLAGVRD